MMKQWYWIFVWMSVMTCGVSVVSSCSLDDEEKPMLIIDPVEPAYTVDASGVPHLVPHAPVSRSRFDSVVVGRGWYCDATFRFTHGTLEQENMWKNMIGASPTHYYFDRDSVTLFFNDDVHGSGRAYSRYAYTYDPADGSISFDGERMMEIVPMGDGKSEWIQSIDWLGYRSEHVRLYGMSYYRAMTKRQLGETIRQYILRR